LLHQTRRIIQKDPLRTQKGIDYFREAVKTILLAVEEKSKILLTFNYLYEWHQNRINGDC